MADELNSQIPAPQPAAPPPPVAQTPVQPQAAAQPPAANPVISSNSENITLNTTSVESKVGLYTRITYISLWVLVIAVCAGLATMIAGNGDQANTLIVMFSVAIIDAPIFIIANLKRSAQIASNPALQDDIFVKKYLRKNLFAAILATAISAFIAISTLLRLLFLSDSSSGGGSGKVVASALIYTLGFGALMAFLWVQHARTTR